MIINGKCVAIPSLLGPLPGISHGGSECVYEEAPHIKPLGSLIREGVG